MPTQIGQYRFANVNACVSPLTATKSYKKTGYTMGEEEEDAGSFNDIQVSAETAFLRDRDYYILMKIPQDMNYDLTFNVKLVKELSTSEEVYQFIKQVKIQKGGNTSNAYRVALYEDLDGTVQAAVPKKYVPGAVGVRNALYYDDEARKFYLCEGDTTYKLTANYNDLFVNASWRREQGDQFLYVEAGFRPVEDGFSKIVLEMIRTAEDYNIQNSETGEVQYGRVVSLDKFEFWLYGVANLVDAINPDGQLDRIGVQGHTGLLTMINGEEIRVGPSGAYEIDVIPITSIGVVATKPTDLFTIDYSFEPIEE